VNDGALTGTGVLVTRPKHQSRELTDAIKAQGGYVFQLPVIDIKERAAAVIRSEFADQPAPDIVIFVSRNAVMFGANIALPGTARIAAIGPATRSAIEQAGLETHIYPETGFDSEHLLQHPELRSSSGKNVTIVRGNNGRELLADTLRARGATVSHLAVYERTVAATDDEVLAQLASVWRTGSIDFVSAMSVDSLTNLLKILPAECRELLEKSWLVTPSKRVIQTALELLPGIRVVLAKSPQASSMVDAVIESSHKEPETTT
jgi:uroporphyrinogen-III synthase